jgi:outer membrane protein assembly factor BamA
MRKGLFSYCCFTLLLLSFHLSTKGQASVSFDSVKTTLRNIISQLPDTAMLRVNNIVIKGNKVTKEYIVLREVSFKKGTYIAAKDLLKTLEKARLDILNTQVFLEVLPSLQNWDHEKIDIAFTVKERWYFFPLPYFKVIDRNINQWIVEQNASLERIDYGLKFNWDNVTGRRDKLNFRYVNGYSRQYSISYEQPYADKKLEKGFLAGIFYTSNRQLSYATDSNKQVFFPVSNQQINDFVKSSFRIETGFTYRKGVYHRHAIRLHYVREQINDTIPALIANNTSKGYIPYYPGNKTKLSTGEFVYSYQYFDLDNIGYPLKGFAFNGSFFQRGLGSKEVNLWQFNAKAAKYVTLAPNTYVSVLGAGLLKFPFNQPVVHMPALGYGDLTMQGLEYYVADGVMAGIVRATLSRQIFKVNVPTLITKNEKYRKIPFRVLFKIYGNIGGSYLPYESTSFLNNKFLYTWGAGFDILSYYDFTARIDYSFNQLGENGLFLRVRRDF